MDKSFKKYLMLIVAVALCIMMTATCVAIAFVMDKRTVNTEASSPKPEVPITSNTGALELPTDHDIRKVDPVAQLPIGAVKKNYVNRELVDPVEITNKYQLMAWLLSDNNADRDAKLINNISFDWSYNINDAAISGGRLDSDGKFHPYAGATFTLSEAYQHSSNTNSAVVTAKIYSGRVLDGYGYSITYDGVDNTKGLTHETAFFAKEILGTMQNITFKVPNNKTFMINNNDGAYDFRVGFLCVYMQASALINNVKVDWGASKLGKKDGDAKSVITGIMAAQNVGTMNNCEINIANGANFQADANEGNAFFGAYGGLGYNGGDGARVNSCSLNFNNNRLSPTFDGMWVVNKSAIVAAIFGDGSNAKINGFITKNADLTVDTSNAQATTRWSYFVGTSNENTVATNLYLLNNSTNPPTNETKFPIVRIATQFDFDLEWDRSVAGRIVIKKIMPDADSIVWNITQEGGKSYNDLYRYALVSNTILSLPAYSPQSNPSGGALFNLTRGEVGVRDTMQFTSSGITTTDDPLNPNVKINSAIYTGLEYTATATFKSAKNVQWNDSNYYAIYYKELPAKPVIPGTYMITVQSKADDEQDVKLFAYFDDVNRRVVFRDDSFTSNNFTLTIAVGETDIVSKKVGNDDYKDRDWASQPVNVTMAVEGIGSSAPSVTRPNKIKVTFNSKEEQASGKEVTWIDTFDLKFSGMQASYMLSISCSDLPVRFALFRDDIQLTAISEESVFSYVDTKKPTFGLDEQSHGGANPIRDLTKWMDRYKADGNVDDNAEVAQVWIKTEAGTSGINLKVSARKMGEDGIWGEPNSWGDQRYQPTDNLSIIDPNIYAQKLYDIEKTRVENAAFFNGIWELSFKAENGAGIPATIVGTSDNIITVTVKVDYSDYNLNADTIKRVWHGTDMNGNTLQILPNDVCAITIKHNGERDYFFRNEAMKYDIIVAAPQENLGYTLATANGIEVPKIGKFEYTASYTHSQELPIGSQPDIAVGLRRLIKGEMQAFDDQTYGNLPPAIDGKVNLQQEAYNGVTLTYKFEPTIRDSSGETVSLTNKKLPVGKYSVDVVASINTEETPFDEMCNKMYELEVKGASYNVTQKLITLTYDSATLASSLRNFNKYWIKCDDFSSQWVEGDIVEVMGIYPANPPKEEDLIGGSVVVTCLTTLNNANYAVVNTCDITLSVFMTDTEDNTIFMLQSSADILAIKDNLLNAKFKMANDIDFKSKAFYGIGNFGGTFDGNGYAIKNIKILSDRSISNDTLNVGLFSSLTSGAVVKNLVISNMILDAKPSSATAINAGVIAGVADGATIDNIAIQGSIYVMGTHKDTAAGVIFGRADNVTINNTLTFVTMYLVNSIGNVVNQPIKGGGVAGVLTNSKLTKVSVANQGYINSTIPNGANYIAAEQQNNNIADNVWYMKDSILSSGVVLTGDSATAKVYGDFLQDTTKFGAILLPRGGVSFEGVMTMVIPASMRANGLARLEVKNHIELMILLNYNFADYKIMKDIYCFDGFNYSNTYKFAGNISNANGYKIYASNGIFNIGQ